jgi:hypothetical protein
MNMGIFAGRGDVILMMFICLMIGFIAGIKTNTQYLRLCEWWRNWRWKRKNLTVDKA